MPIQQLTLVQAEFIAHALATELMNSDGEPIPPFDTRYPGKLESCLAQPFQTFDGKFLYKTFVERAAILFYLVTKNHCFENGNKRMAVTLTALFCFINGRWLNVPPETLYKIACDVADSNPKDMEIMHGTLVKFFRKYLVKRSVMEKLANK
jgi:death-on-curing family protein